MPNPSSPLQRVIPSSSRAPFLIGIGLLGLAFGCRSEQVAHYRVPKETPFSEPLPRPAMPPQPMGERTGEPAPEQPKGPGRPPVSGQAKGQDLPPGPGQAKGQELPPPPKPSTQGALKWSLPRGWSELPGSGMRFATFKAPFDGKLEATVVVLPGPAGGELANVNRWRGQIGLAGLDEAGLTKARTGLKTKAGAVNVYDFTSEGQVKSRMLTGYISTPDGNTWFLKLTGDATVVAKARPDFMTILGSLHLD